MILDDQDRYTRDEFWRWLRESNTAISFETVRLGQPRLVQIVALQRRVERGEFQDDLQPGGG